MNKVKTLIRQPKLTRKQKAFADKLIENPKLSLTQAAKEVYNSNDHVSRNIGSMNMANPNIQLYLDEHVTQAKARIAQLVNTEKEDIALRASQDILDRTYGKATQQVEMKSTSLNINISLSDLIPD